MAGIYLHIPFCKVACSYCNFHFSTQTNYRDEMVSSLLAEIRLQENFFPPKTKIESIYFGGGTPSILPINQVILLLDRIYSEFEVSDKPEITLEANPDDLDGAFLKNLKDYTPVNRLSIGIQSFFDEDLQYMNRAHNAADAKQCLELAHTAGFDNLTCDLIYGTPTLSDEHWEQNLRTLIDLGIPHLSCYALTVEEKTALHHQIQKHKLPSPDEEKTAKHFRMLQDITEAAGYEQYEISNFCKDKKYAVHNSNYWKGVPYLGIGPSAHSFNGSGRCWNVANNAEYMKVIASGKLAQACETLSPIDRYNENALTGLRTKWGVSSRDIEKQFGGELRKHFEFEIQAFITNGWVNVNDGVYTLSKTGKLFCDFITEQVFWIEEE